MDVAGALQGNIAVCPKIGEYRSGVPWTAYIGYLIPGARVGNGDSGTLPEAEELDGGDVVPSADMTALRTSAAVLSVGPGTSHSEHGELDIGQTDSKLG